MIAACFWKNGVGNEISGVHLVPLSTGIRRDFLQYINLVIGTRMGKARYRKSGHGRVLVDKQIRSRSAEWAQSGPERFVIRFLMYVW